MRRQLGILASCILSAIPLVAQSNDPDGCRPLPVKVVYESQSMDEMHVNTLHTVRILDASPGASQVKIAIYSPSARTQWDSRLFEEYVETEDAGRNWRGLGSRFSPIVTPGNDYLRAPSDKKVLYQKVDDGRYARSDDGGSTWKMPLFRIADASNVNPLVKAAIENREYRLDFTILAIHPTHPLSVYAAVEIVPWIGRVITSTDQFVPGIYSSTDGGETWTLFSKELVALGPDYLRSAALGISPSNPSVMYGIIRAGVARTEDEGQTWELVGQQDELMQTDLPKGALATVAERTTHVPFQIQQIAIDPKDDRVMYVVSDKGIHRTLDGGKSWDLLDLGIDRWNNCLNLWIDPSNTSRILVGTKSGLLLSEDRGCHFERVKTPAD